MSLAIQCKKVHAVLLADGWHEVDESTFGLDAYEFLDEEEVVHGGGQSGVCATGFAFADLRGNWIGGPLTSILAIRWGERAGGRSE